jgi:predicted HNH restriction endonuclease
MTKRNEFDANEISQAKAEECARLKRVAAYKAKWHQAKRAENLPAARAKAAAYQREWRAKNREKAREISRVASAKYSADNPATRRKSLREYNARRRAETIEFYGGKCVRCEFSDIRALQVDHIHGGGKKERDAGRHGLFELWKITRDDPVMARATFQLLCANCNSIKRHENYEFKRSARLRKEAGL